VLTCPGGPKNLATPLARRKPHNEELRDLYSSPNHGDDMGGALSPMRITNTGTCATVQKL
jgi:hypothetical protein